MKKLTPKFCGSAYRILVLIKELTKKTCSFDEISEILSNDPTAPKYISNDSIQKYINTIRETGGEIKKTYSNGVYKFSLEKYPFSYRLNEKAPFILANLKKNINTLHQNKLNEVFEKILAQLLKYADLDQKQKVIEKCNTINFSKKDIKKYSKYKDLIAQLEETCIDKQRVTIIYKHPQKEEQKILLEPQILKYKKNKIYFIGYNALACEKQGYLLDFIKEVRQTPQKSKYNNITTPVTFKLKGRLAKGYRLYEEEKIIKEFENNEITIANYQEDRESLIQRFLKYGENCEILTPAYLRNNFLNILCEIEKNYN